MVLGVVCAGGGGVGWGTACVCVCGYISEQVCVCGSSLRDLAGAYH